MYSEKWFYVYIMTNRFMWASLITFAIASSSTRQVLFEGFTSRYKVDRLVYWETFKYVNAALAREKQLKRWTRVKKMQLMVNMNPEWKDLAEGWFADPQQGQNT